MPIKLIFFLITFCVVFMIFIYTAIKKRKILLKYALIWIVFFFCMIASTLLPGLLKEIATLIGIKTVSNMVFLFGFIMLLFINFSLTSIVSKQKTEIISLAQELSILNKKIEKIDHDKI